MEFRQRYADGGFDRMAERREDQAWLAARLNTAETRIHPISRGRSLIADAERPLALSPGELGETADAADAILLGVDGDDVCHFAIDLSNVDDGETAQAYGASWHDLRDVAAELPHRDAAILAFARGMVHWHGSHRFCGVCGGETASQRAGHMRRCLTADCGRMHFPRTDPAVITLVTDGDRCLLARRAIWPAGRRSTIAGFVEPGETLEDAVRREILEEVGVSTGAVAYQGSQPWPFPSSLMMGFRAAATDTAIAVDGDEIAEADWYHRDEIPKALATGDLKLPPADSISFWLVNTWLNGG